MRAITPRLIVAAAAAAAVAELWARRRRGRAKPRKAGALKGQIIIGPEFDEIPDGFEDLDPRRWTRVHSVGPRSAERQAFFDRLEENPPPWAVSIAEAAQELGVSEDEVRGLIAERQLGAVAGRIVTRNALAWYIRRRDLEQFPSPELTDPWEPEQP